jgi:hypothetical protein
MIDTALDLGCRMNMGGKPRSIVFELQRHGVC